MSEKDQTNKENISSFATKSGPVLSWKKKLLRPSEGTAKRRGARRTIPLSVVAEKITLSPGILLGPPRSSTLPSFSSTIESEQKRKKVIVSTTGLREDLAVGNP